jgi:hypothetical protein
MIDPVLSTCRQWIELALGTAVNEVIYQRKSGSDAPQPARPYAAIMLISDDQMSAIPYEVTTEVADAVETEKVVQERSEKRIGTLKVDVFGVNSVAILRALRPSVRHENARALLLAAVDADGNLLDIAIHAIGPIVETTDLRGTAWDPSAQAEYRVSWVHRDVSAVPYIETVDTTGITFE